MKSGERVVSCPFCACGIEDEVPVCDRCHVPQHIDCWELNKDECAIFGCRGKRSKSWFGNKLLFKADELVIMEYKPDLTQKIIDFVTLYFEILFLIISNLSKSAINFVVFLVRVFTLPIFFAYLYSFIHPIALFLYLLFYFIVFLEVVENRNAEGNGCKIVRSSDIVFVSTSVLSFVVYFLFSLIY